MKFIHIADMHFDTPFSLLNSKNNLGNLRRIEQRKVFKKTIDYIKENNIKYLFISGDLYEHQGIKITTIEYINNLFKEIPKTKIFITPGNHDPYIKNSYYNTYNWNENVYIFKSNVEKIAEEDCDVYGFGFDDFYCNKLKIEEIKISNKDKINILVIHGSLDASDKVEKQYNSLPSNELKKLGFDYIALGHIHKPYYNSKESPKIAYPGSMISMGFDEQGEHGMLEGNIEKDKLELKFIKLDEKEFVEKIIDISQITTEEELVENLNQLETEENKLYKIILVGSRKIKVNTYNLLKLVQNENILKIKNQTKIDYNLEELSKKNNLKGIFVKNMLAKSENYTKEEIERAIEIGLEVLK